MTGEAEHENEASEDYCNATHVLTNSFLRSTEGKNRALVRSAAESNTGGINTVTIKTK